MNELTKEYIEKTKRFKGLLIDFFKEWRKKGITEFDIALWTTIALEEYRAEKQQ